MKFLLKNLPFLLLISVTSCGFGGFSSNSSFPPENSGASDPNLLLISEGQYTQLQSHPNPYYGHLQNGCLASGSTVTVPQVDARLNIGMNYEINFRSLQPSTPLIKASLQGTVILKTATTVSMSGSVSSVTNISGITSGYSATRTCVFDSASGNFPCVYLPMPTISLPAGAYNNCDITNGTQTSWNISSGQFTTVKGQTVPAYKLLTDYTGDIVCDGTNLGPGLVKYMMILTNNVPAEDTVKFCGGVKLFYGSSFYLNNGTHILTSSFEKIRVPTVP